MEDAVAMNEIGTSLWLHTNTMNRASYFPCFIDEGREAQVNKPLAQAL